MRLLDLYCGAGGAAEGYHRAGFTEIVGVDWKPQPHYPFLFIQGDALEYLYQHGREFDAVHASPPCQKHSVMTKGRWHDRLADHGDMIFDTRELLVETGKPYIIENVQGAKDELINPLMLCGTMFGLQTAEGSQLRRHRLFETSFKVECSLYCKHNNGSAIGVYGGGQHPSRRRPATIGVWGNAGGKSIPDGLDHYGIEARKQAMGIDWMTGKELSQAIPPAFTHYIGVQLMQHIIESE